MDESNDESVPAEDIVRAQAGRRLIAQFRDDGPPEPDWAESKQALMHAQAVNRGSQ